MTSPLLSQDIRLISPRLGLAGSREIIFPFDLRASPPAFSGQNLKLLIDLFPTTQAVEFDDRVLIFRVQVLPPKPWPKRVAGVPCYLTNDANDKGPVVPCRYRSRSRIDISQDLNLRDSDVSLDVISDLLRAFFAKAQIPITEIQVWDHLVVIVLEQQIDQDEVLMDHILRSIPHSVARCTCLYLSEHHMDRPRALSAQRLVCPKHISMLNEMAPVPRPISTLASNHHPWQNKSLLQRMPPLLSKMPTDDSQYTTLRLGVIVSSVPNSAGESMRSSSGALVKDHLGSTYMTTAAHSFPFDKNVYHPSPGGAIIGEITTELTHTDIALAKLGDGVDFMNESFGNTSTLASPFRLGDFIRVAETKRHDLVFLDTPFTGLVEGQLMSKNIMRILSDDQEQEIWIKTQWSCMGQDSAHELVDGACGSAIWNTDHRVLGFLSYASGTGPYKDHCLSIAADHLLDRGIAWPNELMSRSSDKLRGQQPWDKVNTP